MTAVAADLQVLHALYLDLGKIFGANSDRTTIAIEALQRCSALVRTLQPPEVEAEAFRIQEMSDENRSFTDCLLEVIAGVLDATATELVSAAEVRRNGDDG